jgi:Putative metal-binding domain of cation transport ATPase
MVDTIKCDHCGAEVRHVVTKEFDGKLMNFCCRGCLAVYELQREEILHLPQKLGTTKRTQKKKYAKHGA